MSEKCFNCGERTEQTVYTDDDVELCEACYLEVPTEVETGIRAAAVRGSVLERVTEVGPCPACRRLTVKTDDGGTRCLYCAEG